LNGKAKIRRIKIPVQKTVFLIASSLGEKVKARPGCIEAPDHAGPQAG
jgi:hypothetical protein